VKVAIPICPLLAKECTGKGAEGFLKKEERLKLELTLKSKRRSRIPETPSR
jgi:hypothetical protein